MLDTPTFFTNDKTGQNMNCASRHKTVLRLKNNTPQDCASTQKHNSPQDCTSPQKDFATRLYLTLIGYALGFFGPSFAKNDFTP